MSSLSYSFHVSGGQNAIKSAADLGRAEMHNGRKYDDYKARKLENNLTDTTSAKDNVYLVGDSSLSKNIKEIYKKEFSKAIEKYNSEQTRDDRKIEDYFQHVSKLKNQQLADEIIIQVGTKGDREELSLSERKKTIPVFEGQVKKFTEDYPDFKIAQAVIHFDESSPHLHMIGVSVGYSRSGKGLAKKVQKSNIFNRKSLERMQVEMRRQAEIDCKKYLSNSIEFTEKRKGRNKDYKKQELVELNEKIQSSKEEYLKLVDEINNLNAQINKTLMLDRVYKPYEIKVKDKDVIDKVLGSKDVKISEEDFVILQGSVNQLKGINARLKIEIAENSVLKDENSALKAQIETLENLEFQRDLKAKIRLDGYRDQMKNSIRDEFIEQIQQAQRESEEIKALYKPNVVDLIVKESQALKEENATLKSENTMLVERLQEKEEKVKSLNRQLNKYENKNLDDFFR